MTFYNIWLTKSASAIAADIVVEADSEEEAVTKAIELAKANKKERRSYWFYPERRVSRDVAWEFDLDSGNDYEVSEVIDLDAHEAAKNEAAE